ncbi:MAG: AAA family ATPase, partial [Actinomycetota bacterium]|nr:AAA family ATPase [Actinomycetota bacterium]
MDYRPRFADAQLQERLSSAGAVVIEGAKAVGKTATAQRQAGSVVFLDTDMNARTAAEIDPSLVLKGETPRLIDEWQTVPAIWNHIRREADERGAPGQFILTGSAVAADDATRHTGAGRISRVRMRTLSLYESGASSGAVSLSGIMQSQATSAPAAPLALPDLVDLIIRGGWPATIDRDMDSAARYVVDYLEEISRADVVR